MTIGVDKIEELYGLRVMCASYDSVHGNTDNRCVSGISACN
jgi:hypothetical protein